jgi:bacillopeptidase F
LGIEDTAHNIYSFSSVQQIVTIPVEATGARLSFWHFTQAGDTDDYGYIMLRDANQTWRILSIIRQPSSGWQRVEVDISPYTRQTVLLRFGVRNDGQGATMAIYLDDVSLQACQH